MLVKHRALSRYYHKQSKVMVNNAESREEKQFELQYKREDDMAKLSKMEMKRETQAEAERVKLLSRIAEKEIRAEEA